MYSKRASFIFATFLHPDFCKVISFSKILEKDISKENPGCKKVAKTKFVRFEKIWNASNLHFFDEIFIECWYNEFCVLPNHGLTERCNARNKQVKLCWNNYPSYCNQFLLSTKIYLLCYIYIQFALLYLICPGES